jgi:hypothetical protein
MCAKFSKRSASFKDYSADAFGRTCFRIAQVLFFLISSERIFMAKTTTDAGPARLQRPALVGYSLLLAVLISFGLYALFISGPAMRQAGHEYLVRIIAEENRQFCETFGIRSASAAFTACSGELAIIRQKQVDRDKAAAQGVF